jgi:flagellar motor switch protein FliN/FliY
MDDEHDDTELEDDFPDDDFFADDEAFFDEEEDEEEEELSGTEDVTEEEFEVVAEEPEPTHPPVEQEPLAGADEIPMTIHVEVARVKMPLNSLMELQAGNLLDLKVKPENPVSLVVNGQVIGRGELVVVGDVVGVKVLEVG